MQGLFVTWYNFVRKHETLKGNTLSMARGLSDQSFKAAIAVMLR